MKFSKDCEDTVKNTWKVLGCFTKFLVIVERPMIDILKKKKVNEDEEPRLYGSSIWLVSGV